MEIATLRYNRYTEAAMADSEIIFAVEEASEGGYAARALCHSIFTQGETMEELEATVHDAVRCHFDEAYPTAILS